MAERRTNRIAEQRKAKGWTQQQLADALGVHWITVSKLERGITRLHQEWLERLSDVLNVDPNSIILRSSASRRVAVSGRVFHGGEVEAIGEDKDLYFNLYIDAIHGADVVWIRVEQHALWPYFKDGDMLALQWAEDADRLNELGSLDYSRFFGRFCLVEDTKGAQFMGILSAGSKSEVVTLHNANFPPLLDIEPTALAQVTLALMAITAMPVTAAGTLDSD